MRSGLLLAFGIFADLDAILDISERLVNIKY